MGRDKEDRLGDGEVVDVQDAQRARRAIARPNYMAMDRPDLRVCNRQLSQRMSSPVTGTVTGIKRVLRYRKNYPRGWTCYAWATPLCRDSLNSLASSELYRDLDGGNVFSKILADASACKGMLLRKGAEKVKHLSTKQLWSQRTFETYQVEVVKIPRKENVADMLTHTLQGEALHILHPKVNFERS